MAAMLFLLFAFLQPNRSYESGYRAGQTIGTVMLIAGVVIALLIVWFIIKALKKRKNG
jgi:hypothetical protein